MSQAMTLFIQIILTILGGTASIAVLIARRKSKRELSLVFSWMLYVFYNLWVINVFRLMLLFDDEIPAYSENKYLLVADIVLVAAVSVFVCLTKTMETKQGKNEKTAWCIILMLGGIVCFVKLLRQYFHLNMAVYGLFQPDNIGRLGLIVLLGYLIYEKAVHGLQDKHSRALTLSVSLLVSVTFFLYPAFETLLTNADEFNFSINRVWYMFVLFGFFVFIVSAVVMYLFPYKKRRILCFALWAVSICAYIQGMLFNNRLFLMEGKKQEWSEGLDQFNLIVWALCFVLLLGLCFLVKKSRWKMIVATSVGLCLMQITGILSVVPSYQKHVSENSVFYQNYLSTQGLYEAASEDNVVVFVLDTYDVDFLDQVLEKQPDFLEPLAGFIFYPDTVSQFSRTFPSIPYMLTGKTYFYEEPQSEYIDKSFAGCSFWDKLKKSGYQYYLFEEDENMIGKTILTGAANFISQGHVRDEEISFSGCAMTAVKIGCYRLFPYVFKNYFSYTSEDINDMVVSRRILDTPKYEGDDALIYQQLKKSGITIEHDKKAFRFIHTKGAHAPYTMNEKGEKVKEENCTPIQQYIGCMKFVYEYLSQMKQLGIYEKSTIIITADHGENFVAEKLSQNTNPILFVKPANAGAQTPLQYTTISASQNDLLPTIAGAMGIDYDEGEGLDLLHITGEDKKRKRYHYYTVVEDNIQTKARVYEIDGDSRDFANWTATQQYYEFGEFY